MFAKLKELAAKIKALAAEYAIWAEKELAGKSGGEKRAAVIDKIASLISLPWYLAPFKRWIIGYAVDLVVDKLNWITGWDFAETSDDVEAVETVMAIETRGAAAPAYSAADAVDARLNELYAMYGILKDESAVEPITTRPTAEQLKTEEAPMKKDTLWESSIVFTLKWEGGANFRVVDGVPKLKSGSAADMGGLTNYGITAATLAAANAQGLVSHADITRLTVEEAKAIYKANYWDKYGWGTLAWPVCLCCFDMTVNHGPGGMARIAQRACNALGAKLEVDGKYGPKTKDALLSLAGSSPVSLAGQLCLMRKDYYDRIIASNPSQAVFRAGWYNRLNALTDVAGVARVA